MGTAMRPGSPAQRAQAPGGQHQGQQSLWGKFGDQWSPWLDHLEEILEGRTGFPKRFSSAFENKQMVETSPVAPPPPPGGQA